MTNKTATIIPFPREKVRRHDCPDCGSDHVAQIVYGMPLDGSVKGAQHGSYLYSGSFQVESCKWHCNVCDREW